jgi:hypothetical protein
MTLYKVLGTDRKPHHGGAGQWPKPGQWITASGPLKLCKKGTLHLCRRQDLVHWLGPEIWVAEARGEIIEGDDKVGCLEARLVRKLPWDDLVARLFACDCAEIAMECHGNGYERSWNAIHVARSFALGLATKEEMAAARAAAWDAARAAAVDAAWYAARDAAWHAARDAARDAAVDAAWYAERDFQTELLMQYLGEE